ncbi:MAG: hypothetical protein NTW28_00395 [Candidatus Solibacter sp.]|nr:hypothetical protein [Candidatus Solibacter sp.]
MNRIVWACALAFVWACSGQAQVIEFESNGLKYLTLTKSGVTIMFATLPQRLRDYAILQVAVSNGSKSPYVIRPEDFTYVRLDGSVLRASAARVVVTLLEQRGSASDVIKLVTSYENSISGGHLKSTNGYEQRRQSVLAMGSVRLKAAAAASALALVQTKLMPGESTDGAIFFPTDGKMLGFGHIVVRTNADVFNFTTD